MIFHILDHAKKKHNGKYCGHQSYLGLQKTEKNYSCCLHHQNFHKKPSFIVVPIVCSQIASTIAPHIDLTVRPSCPELHKQGHGLEDMSFHRGFEIDGLKKVKLEFPKHDVLEIEEMQDDLESCILKARCEKVMIAWLMKLEKM